MPLYDFVLKAGDSTNLIISPRMEAPDLKTATAQATIWAQENRRIHGEPDDAAKWPMHIVESREPHEQPPEHKLFEVEDVPYEA